MVASGRQLEVQSEARGLDGAAVVQGTPAANGAYVGIARVLADRTDVRMIQPGDVVICANASPTVLAAPIGALVTDFGGVLSNPAIISRERAIPAVFATVDATRRIRDGQRVRVDGARGRVTVLD